MWGRCGVAHVHDPLCSGPYDVHDGVVIVNLLQDWLYGLQFYEVAAPGFIFHALQLIVENGKEFLVTVVVNQAPAELQRCRDALEQHGELLDGRNGRIVIFGAGVALNVFVGQFLGAGKCELAIAGIDLAGEIMGLRRQIENPGTGRVGEREFGLVGLAVLRVFRDLRGALVAGVTIRLNGDGMKCSGSELGKSREKVTAAAGSAARVGRLQSRARHPSKKIRDERSVHCLRLARCGLASLVPIISLRFVLAVNSSKNARGNYA